MSPKLAGGFYHNTLLKTKDDFLRHLGKEFFWQIHRQKLLQLSNGPEDRLQTRRS